jgi:hypothetical protein
MTLVCQLKTESTYVPARRMLKNKIATCIIKNNNNQSLIITVDGYTYKFKTQFKNKNKYFRCEKSKTERCRGSVTLSPYETVVRKRFHTCSCICKVENKTLEEVHEYEETDKKTKINDVQCQDQILDQVQEYEETDGKLKINQQSTPEIEVLFWIKYFAFTFN